MSKAFFTPLIQYRLPLPEPHTLLNRYFAPKQAGIRLEI
jgi:hypothetical protein